MNRWIFNLLITILVLLVSACATTSKIKGVQLNNVKTFEQINLLYEQDNYEAATKIMDDLSSSPDLTDTEIAYIGNYRANICFSNQDYDCALSEFEKILEKKSSVPENFYKQIVVVLAGLHIDQKNYSQARQYANEALESDPNNGSLKLLMGKIDYLLENYTQSIKYLNDALNSTPNRGELFLGRTNLQQGLAHEAMGSNQVAKQKFNSALTFALDNIDRSHLDSTINLGVGKTKVYYNEEPYIILALDAYQQLNRLEDATELVDSLNKVNPKTKYLLLIANYYQESGYSDKAQSMRQQLIRNEKAGYKDGRLIVWNTEGEILPIYRAAPVYPRRAANRRIEGWVDLKTDIDTSGKTKNIRVTDSSVKNLFDDAAIEAVSKYLYKPIIKNGQPTEFNDSELRLSFEVE